MSSGVKHGASSFEGLGDDFSRDGTLNNPPIVARSKY